MNPVSVLVDHAGEAVVLIIPVNASYNPNVATDWAPGTPLSLPMRAVYQKTSEVGLATSRLATLTFTTSPFDAPFSAYIFSMVDDAAVIMNGAAVVGRIQNEVTRIRARGNEYVAGKIRTRDYLGQINGFTLEIVR
jgi:hypothetical protein